MDYITDIINLVFPYDGIYEVILGTNGEKPNLAPIGIIKSGNVLKSKIYRNTITFSNLLKFPKCSINIVSDSNLFFNAFFDELKPNTFLEDLPIINQGYTLLANCYYEKLDDPSYFFYKIYFYRKNSDIYPAFNRGNSMLIDLLVHFSRLDIYTKEDLEKYLPIIKYEIEIIRKTMPNSFKNVEKLIDLLTQKGLKI
ncbi:DUF447 family protein [Sulfurisphaera javensis]|uniref:DUF447 family protein n=1 Tax=Sulfurisphaera javensis TaxID=2049879 RepID=A0AAT9GRR0_9CREN